MAEDKPVSKVEVAKENKSPPPPSPVEDNAKQEVDNQAKVPTETKPDTKQQQEVKSSKAQKNQFALNRLVLMLMDVDPTEMSPDMIDGLVKAHSLLAGILVRQSVAVK